MASRQEISYRESVAGTHQNVDVQLPEDAFASAKAGGDLAKFEMRYREPITAMQDCDLTFPDHIEFAYYSLYNLFLRYALGEQIDDWLIVNQALSSEDTEDLWRKLLQDAIGYR